jgi:alkylglycerol monooxygenase
LFGKPDDLDPRYRLLLERKFLNVQPQLKPTLAMRQYVTAQTIFSIGLLFSVALFEHYFTGFQLFLLSSFIIVSLVNSGAILDQRRWIFYLEVIRVVIVMAAIAVAYKNSWTLVVLTTLLTLLVWYFRPMQRVYMRLLYHK